MPTNTLYDLPNTAAYLNRINAEPRTMTKAVVREEHGSGYWRDVAIVKFAKNGEVRTDIAFLPTEDEQTAITAEFVKLEWPDSVFIDLHDPQMPKIVREADDKNKFIFKNEDGKIIMIQIRQEKRDGKKAYIPVTKWSDGEFRFLEPEGDLPLFGLENIRGASTIMLVEGAKTARYLQWMIDSKTAEARQALSEHPWGKSFTGLVVLGWCSGALSPHRVDWSPIRKHGITRAYVSLDNDEPGRSALPVISKNLHCVTHSVEFSDDWPACADLYDPFPAKFWKTIGDKKYYVGPSFAECTQPATYMTSKIPHPEDPKKDLVVLRNHARSLWHFVEDTQEFIYVENPRIIRKADVLDATLRPFCDTKKLSELLLTVFNGRMTSFDYCPFTEARKIHHNGRPVINLYMPAHVQPQDGDITPFMKFMENLIPDEKERHQTLRWCATLIARPDIRMLYALMLVSTETGTGKSTLLWIMQELVGRHNSSTPTERIVAGEFNNWVQGVRLVGIHEIYSGQSWKMFNALKDLITEPIISIRRMYRDPVDMSNFAHFIMCSNSLEALKIDEKDRRIFAPTVTEKRWSDKQFDEFREWLESGGFSIIAFWAKNFGDYVSRSEKAPMTSRKLEMIANSKSEASVRCEDLGRLMNDADKPVAIGDKEIKSWLQAVCKERVYETALSIRKEIRKAGIHELTKEDIGGDGRISFSSQMQNVLLNKKAIDKIMEIEDIGQRKEMVRSFMVRPQALFVFED